MGHQNYRFNGHYHVEKYTGTESHERVPNPGWPFKICKGAFQGCATLETVELPEGCVCIDEAAFKDCVNLREITLPRSLRTIHSQAFSNCPQLQKLHFPQGVYNDPSQTQNPRLYVCANAFDGCTALADENGFVVIDHMARQHLHPGPNITVTEGIRGFLPGLFRGREDIRTIQLPESLTEIASETFLNCKNLEIVHIPGSVRRIAWQAFHGCENLFPTGSDFLISDGWLCGYRGTGSHVIIPEEVTTIADNVFEKHEEIRSVSIPESVSCIGAGAFAGCTGLTAVILPSSLEILNANTFRDCSALRTVQLPAELKEISFAAFARCNALCDITLPEGLTTIGSLAFQDCAGLHRLKLPESLQDIAANALRGTPVSPREDGLVIVADKVMGYQGPGGEVLIPEGVTAISFQAFTKTEITSVHFPKTLRHIEAYAFSRCQNLTSITIPEGLETIGQNAFWSCSIREVHFPESLRVLEARAFSENEIQEVILPGGLEKLEDNVFENCPVCAISLPENLFKDHGARPGEFSKWVDSDIDNNPFPYRKGELIRTRLICPDTGISQQVLGEWAALLHLEDPIFQIWHRNWYDDEPYLKADDYLPEDIYCNGPNLLSLSPTYFGDRHPDQGDYLVVILHRQKLETLIREDDETVVNYLGQIGPDILRELIALGETSGSEKVLPLLHELLDNFYIDGKDK